MRRLLENMRRLLEKSKIIVLMLFIVAVVSRIVPVLDFISYTREYVGYAVGFLVPQNAAMSGAEIRMAVPGFAGEEFDEDKRIEIAEIIYHRLAKEIGDLPDGGPTITIWGPDKVGIVSGSSQIERAYSAGKIARRTHANVVVYGVVESAAYTSISPEFYVSQEESVVAGSATEASWSSEMVQLTGAYYLGKPITTTATLNNFVATKAVNDAYSCRFKVLMRVIYGLDYYFQNMYVEAEREFSEVDSLECNDKQSGTEILYVMAGNAAGRSGDIDKSYNYYTKALAITPGYTRALLGLGSVKYMQAVEIIEGNSKFDAGQLSEIDVGTQRLTLNMILDTAEAHHYKALLFTSERSSDVLDEKKPEADALALCAVTTVDSTQNSTDPDIRSKACFGLGQVAFLRELILQGTHDTARAYFESVFNYYEKTKNERIRVLAAESAIMLGRISWQACDSQSAIDNYENALKLHTDASRKDLIQQRITELKGPSLAPCRRY